MRIRGMSPATKNLSQQPPPLLLQLLLFFSSFLQYIVFFLTPPFGIPRRRKWKDISFATLGRLSAKGLCVRPCLLLFLYVLRARRPLSRCSIGQIMPCGKKRFAHKQKKIILFHVSAVPHSISQTTLETAQQPTTHNCVQWSFVSGVKQTRL